MTREEERRLEVTVYNLYMATIAGLTDRARKVQARMTNEQIGDMVVEISTIYNEARVGARVGRLREKRMEPYYTPEEWAKEHEGFECAPGPIPERMVWHVELADGSVITWDDCDFIAIPPEIVR